MHYIIRRLLHAAFLLIGVSLLSFALFEFAPGNYLDEMRANPQIPVDTIEKYRRNYGLDQMVHIRYWKWLTASLRGDLGVSFSYNLPTIHLLRPRVINTVLLSASSLLLVWMIALPLGIWSASRPRSLPDLVGTGFATAIVSLPDLLIALACLAIAVRTGWFKVAGSFPLAVLASALIAFPAIFRHTRRSIAEVLRLPFVEHLHACGLADRRILFTHVLPAAAPPLLTLMGLSIATLLSSGLIVEVVLSWPGLGPLLLESILARDFPVVIAAVMMATTLLVLANLASDLALYAADPRIRRNQS